MLWQMQMADTMEGYELTSPPLVVKDKVIMGVGGGEYAIRGFVDAYDAASGKRLWRFYTVPGPGEFGHDTWKGDSWQKGGSAAWLTPTFDPDLNLVYVPIGNPAPQIDRTVRGVGLDDLMTPRGQIARRPERRRRRRAIAVDAYEPEVIELEAETGNELGEAGR